MTGQKKCDVTYGQTDRQTDRRTEGQTDGRTDDGKVIPLVSPLLTAGDTKRRSKTYMQISKPKPGLLGQGQRGSNFGVHGKILSRDMCVPNLKGVS